MASFENIFSHFISLWFPLLCKSNVTSVYISSLSDKFIGPVSTRWETLSSFLEFIIVPEPGQGLNLTFLTGEESIIHCAFPTKDPFLSTCPCPPHQEWTPKSSSTHDLGMNYWWSSSQQKWSLLDSIHFNLSHPLLGRIWKWDPQRKSSESTRTETKLHTERRQSAETINQKK